MKFHCQKVFQELDPALVSEWNADDMELIIPLLDRYVRHG